MECINIVDVKVVRSCEGVLIRNLTRAERARKCVVSFFAFLIIFLITIRYEKAQILVISASLFFIIGTCIYILSYSGKIRALWVNGNLKCHECNIPGVDSFWEYEDYKQGYNYYRCYYGVKLENGGDVAVFELRAQSLRHSHVWRDFARMAGHRFEILAEPPNCLSRHARPG
jgi:hypothetical protein